MSRASILALRPAPIQVSYLGLLGTMGAEFIDYVIADEIVLPFDRQPFFTERIVHLPDCFMVSDDRVTATQIPAGPRKASRQRGSSFRRSMPATRSASRSLRRG